MTVLLVLLSLLAIAFTAPVQQLTEDFRVRKKRRCVGALCSREGYRVLSSRPRRVVEPRVSFFCFPPAHHFDLWRSR